MRLARLLRKAELPIVVRGFCKVWGLNSRREDHQEKPEDQQNRAKISHTAICRCAEYIAVTINQLDLPQIKTTRFPNRNVVPTVLTVSTATSSF